jgi:tRNA-guanine transglycosylase
MSFGFRILKKDKKTKARIGILKTPHGLIHTPTVSIVATKGAIRGLDFDLAYKFGAEIFMINTFHFFYNNRYKIVKKFGGLHKFLNINYPLMTDSGGFQVFSLGFGIEHGVGKIADIFPLEGEYTNKSRIKNELDTNNKYTNKSRIKNELDTNNKYTNETRIRRINRELNKNEFEKNSITFVNNPCDINKDKFVNNSCDNIRDKFVNKSLVKIYDEGVEFTSPYDGKKLFFTPELSIEIQKILGADIIFSFDECTSPLSDYEYTKKALERTHNWALRCLKKFKSKNQVMFGIVQGGEYRDLREESARFINSLNFFGYGIGGALGKSKKDMHNILEWVIPLLDENKPRHLLGIGEIDDIFEAVERGIDLFDCVIPTRWARHGAVFTYNGRLNLKSNKYLNDKNPIDKNCKCRVCKNFSRAYLAHLMKEKELYGIMLLTEHNVFWILNLMKEIRNSIKEGRFLKFKEKILNQWRKKV